MKNLSDLRLVLKEAERRGELMGCLASLKPRGDRIKFGEVLSSLHNAGDISLMSSENLCALEKLEHNEFWIVVHFLDDAVPALKCSFEEVLRLVNKLVERAGTDGAAGMPNLAFVRWCQFNPGEAREIVDAAKQLDPLCLNHCAFAVRGLGDVALAFELAHHSEGAVALAGLRSLGWIDLHDEGSRRKALDACLDAVAKADIENRPLRATALETVMKIWGKYEDSEPYRQVELVKLFLKSSEGYEVETLAAMLFYYSKAVASETIQLILKAARTEVSEPEAILRILDQALYRRDERWSLDDVVETFEFQISNLQRQIASRSFPNFCEWICSDGIHISMLIVRWLRKGDFGLCSFLGDMFGAAERGELKIEILPSDLPAAAEEQIFIARKCIGFFWIHEVTAASILFGIVKMGNSSAQEAVEEMLFDPLLLSYGGRLRDYISEQCNSESELVAACANRLLARHEEYIKGLKQAEHLVELAPTIEQRRAASARDRERDKDMQSRVEEESILLKLVTRQVMLYGRKSFVLVRDVGDEEVPSLTPLSEYSYSAEIPRLSVVDPVGFSQMLLGFRSEKRS